MLSCTKQLWVAYGITLSDFLLVFWLDYIECGQTPDGRAGGFGE